MITTKRESDLSGILSTLLFSSMHDPTESYLSQDFLSEPGISKKKVLKSTLISIDKKISSLFKKKSSVKSIDNEVESALTKAKNLEPEIENLVTKMFDYEEIEKKPVDLVKTALKNLYSTFVSYAKGTYSAVAASTEKVIMGNVKITMLKLIRVWEYILTALNPQWNRVPGSPEDLDTLAPAITNHIHITGESAKYDSAYVAMRYRTA